MGVLYALIGIVVVLVIDYLIANEFYTAAYLKGHSERKYFWICFLCGIVGYLLVTALPVVVEEEE